jgi:hypothetical protein
MKRFLLNIMLMLAAFILTSCGKDEVEVIPRAKLAKIYAEMLVTDQWITNTQGVRLMADTSMVYEPILEKYGYDIDDYLLSVDKYMDDPERFARIFRTSGEIIEKRLIELRRQKFILDQIANLPKIEVDFRPEKLAPYLFGESYVHYYDSSFASNATLRGNISIANTFADYVYSNYFGIKMNMSASASQYATVLDDCTTGTGNYCTTTSCGSTCNYVHHKNIYTIAQQIYSAPRADNHLYVLWTNRAYGTTYCYTKNGSHTPYEAIAVVIGKKPVIHFLNIYGDTNTQQLACMAVCLVHETAHTLKMNDVYDNEGHDITGETICVMERFDKRTAYEFYQDVLNGVADPFCDSCEQTMIGLTTSTSIKGNQ